MHKIAFYILICCFSSSACSVLKRSGSSNLIESTGSGLITSNEIIQKNVTNEGFYIIKADIELETDGFNQKFMASVKFIPDEYIISLKSRTGIEAARIYMNNDTLLVNDRISKILYYGKPEYLKRVAGYPGNLLPLIFGDFISGDGIIDSLKCIEGQTEVVKVLEGLKLSYIINCKTGKIVEIRQEGSYQGIENVIKLEDFITDNNITYARIINIENRRSTALINIRIDKVEIPWEGVIDFVPGNNYEKAELK